MGKPILVTENDIGISKEIMIKDFIAEHNFVEAGQLKAFHKTLDFFGEFTIR